METIKTHVNIPDDRRLVLDIHIPHTIPTESTEVLLVFHRQKQKKLNVPGFLVLSKERLE